MYDSDDSDSFHISEIDVFSDDDESPVNCSVPPGQVVESNKLTSIPQAVGISNDSFYSKYFDSSLLSISSNNFPGFSLSPILEEKSNDSMHDNEDVDFDGFMSDTVMYERYNRLKGIISDGKEKENENSKVEDFDTIVNWSFDDEDVNVIDIENQETEGPKESTPVEDDSSKLGVPDDISPVTVGFVEACCNETATILSWVQESLHMQQLFLEHTTDQVNNLEKLFVVDSILMQAEAERSCANFSGFGEDVPVDKCLSAVREALNTARKHAGACRHLASSFRANSDFLRGFLSRTPKATDSEERTECVISAEESDPLVHVVSPLSRYMTRSRGNVRNLPHVQPKVLEYLN